MTIRPDLVWSDFPVAEIFGHAPDSNTEAAREAREAKLCPFKGGACTKIRSAAKTGVCAVHYKAEGFETATIWATCANRLAAEFESVRDLAFGTEAPEARIVREVKISDPALTFDGVVLLARDDATVDFVGIEAQTIDTRGGAVKPIFDSYMAGEPNKWKEYVAGGDPFGVNTANVWKRLLPQVINKGRMYADWETQLYVIVQGTLMQFIRRRMHLHELSRQERDRADIVWLPWDYTGATTADGQLETEIAEPIYTTVEAVEQAFTKVASAQRPVMIARALRKLERDDKNIERARRAAELDASTMELIVEIDGPRRSGRPTRRRRDDVSS